MEKSELRESAFFVLTSLADGPKHGYAIIKDIAELSAGEVRLKVATLYGALERLQVGELIAAAGEEVVDGRLRRYFALTESGELLLVAEARRLEHKAQQARVRLSRRAVGATSLSAAAPS